MTSPVLFSTGASPASTNMRNLVEFKAGKMEMRDKMVHAIKKQGLVYLRQSPDDNLMHFCWKDRQSGIVEDDLILFPDDCEFRRVKECTTGRVYVLKMKSSNRKMFFWMQESQADRDEEFCRKINEMLNNPPRASSEIGGSSDRDLQALFGNMTQEQVAQLLSSNGVNLASLLTSAAGRSPSSNSGASASSTAGTTNSAPTSATSITSNASNSALSGAAGSESSPSMNDFRALISGALMDGNVYEANALMNASLAAAGSGETESSSATQARDQQQATPIDLSTAINSESLAHLLNDEEFLRQIEPHLPPTTAKQQQHAPSSSLSSDDRKKLFSETIISSQFRSSLSQFCIALQSGQLGPLMSQFGLNQACVDAANLGNLEAFVRALDTQSARGSSESSAPANVANQQQPRQQPPGAGERKDKT